MKCLENKMKSFQAEVVGVCVWVKYIQIDVDCYRLCAQLHSYHYIRPDRIHRYLLVVQSFP